MSIPRLERLAVMNLPFKIRMVLNVQAVREMMGKEELSCPFLCKYLFDWHESSVQHTHSSIDLLDYAREIYDALRRIFPVQDLITRCRIMSERCDYVKIVCPARLHCNLCTHWYDHHILYWLSLYLLRESCTGAL